jgi:hypothetical protein
MTNQFKIGMANPMTDSCLGTSEKIIENGDLMPEEHEAINEMGADEAGPAGDEDTLAFGQRKKFDGREARECTVRDGSSFWKVNRSRLKKRVAAAGLGMFGLCFLFTKIFYGLGVLIGDNVVRAEVQGTEDI